MRIYVGVTDNEWFRFLRALEPDEVNFWRPGGQQTFKSLEPGEPFLFKLHAPEHAIAGGGFFLRYLTMPVGTAWQTFGQKNGAASFLDMRQAIEEYRKKRKPSQPNFEIGCAVLTQPFFFDDEDWLPAPEDWRPGIVQGKGYDLRERVGAQVWTRVQERLARQRLASDSRPRKIAAAAVANRPDGRLTEGAFRILVTEAYERRCAVTRQPVLPVLEATHIKPISAGGENQLDNGLLLRSDLCRLFDLGYLTVTGDCTVRASRRIREEFHNGEEYLQLNGSPLWVPRTAAEQPRREFLEWHADTVFRG